MAFRWTLAIASRLQSTVRVTSFNSTAFVPILLNSRCYVAGRNPLSEEERQRRDEERKARANETWRLRYQSDPEFREKHKQRCRNNYAIPEYREKKLRTSKEKYANDPQYRDQQILNSSKQYLELKSMLKQDLEAHRLYRDETSKRVREMYHGKAGFRWKTIIATRLRITPRYCDEIVWASHKPVLYPTKTNHTCATCGRKRYGGLKLWYVKSLDGLS